MDRSPQVSRREFLRVLGLTASVAVVHGCAPSSIVEVTVTPSKQPVEITYIDGEGFIAVSGRVKVVMDGMLSGLAGYSHVPDSRQALMAQALPPFDAVDLILASHYHSDHFDPVIVGNHLEHNPRAAFVSTVQAVEWMRSHFEGFERVQDRVIAVRVELGELGRTNVNGIPLEMVKLLHSSNDMTDNLGFIYTIGGNRLFHMGDLAGISDIVADVVGYQLPLGEIDIAFVPYWLLVEDDLRDLVRELIQPRQIIAMHLPRTGWQEVVDGVAAHFPDALAFHMGQAMEVVTIRLG